MLQSYAVSCGCDCIMQDPSPLSASALAADSRLNCVAAHEHVVNVDQPLLILKDP